MFSQLLFHVGPWSENAFAAPVVTTIHHAVENLQTMVAHPDRVGIGESHAQFAAHGRVVFDNDIAFAANVLSGCLDVWPNAGFE